MNIRTCLGRDGYFVIPCPERSKARSRHSGRQAGGIACFEDRQRYTGKKPLLPPSSHSGDTDRGGGGAAIDFIPARLPVQCARR